MNFLIFLVFVLINQVLCSPELEMSACSQRELMACGKPIMAKFNYRDEKSLCCATLSLKPCFQTLTPRCLNAFAKMINNIPQYSSITNGQQFISRTEQEIGYCRKYINQC